MSEVHIKDFEALKHLLIKAEIDGFSVSVFDKLPDFKIKIEGKDYKGYVNADIASSIQDFQDLVYKIYRIIMGFDIKKRLTVDEKESLKLNFVVEYGSTNITNGGLEEIFNYILKVAPDMSGTEITILSLGSIFLFMGFNALNRYIDKKAEIRLKDQDTIRFADLNQSIRELIKKNEKLSAIDDYSSDTHMDFIRKNKNAKHINVNSQNYNEAQIKTIAKSEQKDFTTRELTEMFLITGVVSVKNGLRVYLRNRFNVDIVANMADSSKLNVLLDSYELSETLKITILETYKDGDLESACIKKIFTNS